MLIYSDAKSRSIIAKEIVLSKLISLDLGLSHHQLRKLGKIKEGKVLGGRTKFFKKRKKDGQPI